MGSDWKLIRNLVNSALDACEKAEALQIKNSELASTIKIEGQEVSAGDFLQSSWRYPENLKDCLVRARNKLGEDRKYTDELQRTLMCVGNLAAELVGLIEMKKEISGVDPYHPDSSKSVDEMIGELIRFYDGHMSRNLPLIVETARKAVGG